jgi:mono/diheme cytochrome c family protein
MKQLGLGIVLAFALIGVACRQPATQTNSAPANSRAAASPTASPDKLAFARANYAKHCAACHGDDGKGGTVKVDNKSLRVPSLREGHALHHTDEELAKQIAKGGGGMPKFSEKLKPEEMNDLVLLIRNEFQAKAANSKQ